MCPFAKLDHPERRLDWQPMINLRRGLLRGKAIIRIAYKILMLSWSHNLSTIRGSFTGSPDAVVCDRIGIR